LDPDFSYLYIRVAKSFFYVPREKLSPRPLAAEAANFEDVKGFHGQGVHNIVRRYNIFIFIIFFTYYVFHVRLASKKTGTVRKISGRFY
jgi:hypothetical protein